MTQTLTITAQPRTIKGNDVRKLRRSGKIPGIIYGDNAKDVMFELEYNQFVKLYRESGRTNVVDVTVAEKTYHCLVHDIDMDPVTDLARHIDFLSVNLKQKVTVEVPLEFVGESQAVVQGAILVENLHEVEVEALPNKVPESISVDLSKLAELHDNIHVYDLPVTADYVIVTDGELVVASVVEPEKEEVAPIAEVAAEGAATTAPATEEKKE
jgi:large subunit ribosomal protein L25